MSFDFGDDEEVRGRAIRQTTKRAAAIKRDYSLIDAIREDDAPDSAATSASVARNAPTERTWGEAFKDTGLAAAQGVIALPESVANIAGLVVGSPDNAFSRQAREARETLESNKSAGYRARQKALQTEIDAADGVMGKAGTAFRGMLSDPALGIDALVQSAPSMIGSGAVGLGARAAMLRSAASAGPPTQAALALANRAGVAGAVGSAAGMQGADVGAEAYNELKQLDPRLWEANPRFQELVASGMRPSDAQEQMAVSLARQSGSAAGAISIFAQMLPGGRSIERALIGNLLQKRGLLPAVGTVAKGAVGEGFSEGIEEGGGKAAGNVAVGAVDPSRDVLEGVGEAAGRGAAVGAVMGGAANLASLRGRTPSPGGSSVEPGDSVVDPSGAQATTPSVAQAPLQRVGRDQLLADQEQMPEAPVVGGRQPEAQTLPDEELSERDRRLAEGLRRTRLTDEAGNVVEEPGVVTGPQQIGMAPDVVEQQRTAVDDRPADNFAEQNSVEQNDAARVDSVPSFPIDAEADARADVAPTEQLPSPESYEGIQNINRGEQAARIEDIELSLKQALDFNDDAARLNVKTASSETVAPEMWDLSNRVANTLKKLFDIDVVLADFGTKFNERGQQIITTADGRDVGLTPHGLYVKGRRTVLINAASPKLLDTAIHEPIHFIEQTYPDLYKSLADTVAKYSTAADKARAGTDIGVKPGAELDSEFVAMSLAEAGENSPLWTELFRRAGELGQAQTLKDKIVEVVDALIKAVQGDFRYIKQYNQLRAYRRAVNDAFTKAQIRTAQERLARGPQTAQNALGAPAAPRTSPSATPPSAAPPTQAPAGEAVPADNAEEQPTDPEELYGYIKERVLDGRTRPSTEGVQKAHRIGYARALTTMRRLEQEGVVSPPGERGLRTVNRGNQDKPAATAPPAGISRQSGAPAQAAPTAPPAPGKSQQSAAPVESIEEPDIPDSAYVDPAETITPLETIPEGTKPEEVLVCISCGNDKKQGAARPLYEMYNGPFWQTVRARLGQTIEEANQPGKPRLLVLSAKFGLTNPGRIEQPYNQELDKAGKRGDEIIAEGKLPPLPEGIRTVFLAGSSEYRRVMSALIERAVEQQKLPPVNVVQTTGDLLQQRKKLNAEIGKLLAAPVEQTQPTQQVPPQERQRRVVDLAKRTTRFASGMSAQKDFEAAARSGHPIGVSIAALSTPNFEKLAEQAVLRQVPLFVDSGVFSLLNAAKKGKGKEVDFDKVFDGYDQLADRLMEANSADPVEDLDAAIEGAATPEEAARLMDSSVGVEPGVPTVILAMPDIPKDQAQSLALIEKYKDRILGYFGNGIASPLVPIPLGEMSLTDYYRRVAQILGTKDFIVGIPSHTFNRWPDDQLLSFLQTERPARVHFLAAMGERTLGPRLGTVVDAGLDQQIEVTADASPVGSRVVVKGQSMDAAQRAEKIINVLSRRERDNMGVLTPGEATQTENPFWSRQRVGSGDISFSRVRDAAPGEVEISTQNPTAKNRRYNPIEEMLSIDEAAVEEAMAENPDIRGRITDAILSYGFIPVDTPREDAIKVFKRNIVNNLLFLHDRVPKEIANRSKLWYDGANRIAREMAKNFGLSMQQVAAIMAAMSPQKDWFQNVSMAERAIDILTKHGDARWTDEMLQYARSYIYESKDAKEREKRQDAYDRAVQVMEADTPLKEMGEKDAAVFIRSFDEAFHSRQYRVVTPEGGFAQLVTNNDGTPATMMWSTYGPIEKTVSIFRDGSRENVSDQLGDEHKIRSFYNNIAAPNAEIGHVTIDTHAVAAALFEALAGTDLPVMQNFGGTGKSAVLGVGGTYGIIADAYREAARERGIKPREMQSITWEAVRGLFDEDNKSSIKPLVRAEWDKYRAGESSFEQTREKIIEIARGINDPDWVGSDAGQFVADGGASYDKEFVPEGGLRLRQENELREKTTVNLTAATSSIPGIKELYDRAMSGDEDAGTLIRRVAESSLRFLLSGTSARIEATDSVGAYASEREPSVGLKVAYNESERRPVLAALARFARMYNQEQIHVRSATSRPLGHEFDDGSYSTIVYEIPIAKPLTGQEISDIIAESGLGGLTVTGDTITAYWVRPNERRQDEASLAAFKAGVSRVHGLVAAGSARPKPRTERLYAYGRGDGAAIGYERIDGDVRTRQEADTQTPRLIAEFLRREPVKAFPQKDLTQGQVKDQKALAAVFDALPTNDLDNPLVRRAYEAASEELIKQYKALPVKVEVGATVSIGEAVYPYWGERSQELVDRLVADGAPLARARTVLDYLRRNFGQPSKSWRGKPEGAIKEINADVYANSGAMRKDVTFNNRLKTFKTTPATFGPPGSDFSGHPLLRDSGLKDANGYPMLYNDLLRAVHDYFAHNLSSTQFGPNGEAAAWRNHMSTTTDPLARWAITAETRLQNAWQNFRPEAEGVPVKNRPFAEQKAALPPVVFTLTGNEAVDAPMVEFIKALSESERMGSLPAGSKIKLPKLPKSTESPGAQLSRQTETENFKRWFGKSKIVNEGASPELLEAIKTYKARLASERQMLKDMGQEADEETLDYFREFEDAIKEMEEQAASSAGTPKVMYHGTARDIEVFRAKQAGAIFVTDSPKFAADFAAMSEEWMTENAEQFLTPVQMSMAIDRAATAARKSQVYRTMKPLEQGEFIADIRTGKPKNAAASVILGKEVRTYLPSGQNIIPLYVRAEKPFDYENPAHLDEITATEDGALIYPEELEQIAQGRWTLIEKPHIQRAIKAAGFDAFYVMEGGEKNLAVYSPNQLKSAIGNNGDFSLDRDEIQLSRQMDPEKVFGRALAPLALRAYKGLSFNAKMAVDDWNTGWDTGRLEKAFQSESEVAREVYAAFAPVREKIREIYGDTIRLLRGEREWGGSGPSDARRLFSWSPVENTAKKFATNGFRGYRVYSPEQIDAAVEQFNRTGFMRMFGRMYKRGATPDYYEMYNRSRENITDGETARLREDLVEENEQNRRFNEQEQNKTKPRVFSADIPVESLIWIPIDSGTGSRANLRDPEIIAAYNPRKKPAEQIQLSRPIRYQGDRFTIAERTRAERTSNLMLNEMSRVRDVQQQIAAQGGVFNRSLDVDMESRRQTRLAGNKIERFREQKVDPLMKRMAKLGFELGDVDLLMYARFAPQRNKQIAGINTRFPDGGSGMTDQQAREAIAALQQKHGPAKYAQLLQLAKDFQALTGDTRDVLKKSGLVDPEILKAWEAVGPNYVPLKGFDKIDDDAKETSNTDPRWDFSRRALGRHSRAGQIVQNILKDYERAVSAASVQETRKTLLDFVQENPDDKLWEVDRKVFTQQFRKTLPQSPLGYAEGVVRSILAVNKDKENTVAVRVGGTLAYITIKDPGMVDDMNRLSQVGLPGDFKRFLDGFARINKTLGFLYTAMSPAFVLTNAARDLAYGTVRTARNYGAAAGARIPLRAMAAVPGIYKAIITRNWDSQTGGKYERWFNEFREVGGAMGIVSQLSVDNQTERLERAIARYQGAIKDDPKTWHRPASQAASALVDFVVKLNMGIEQAVRVAAYAEARESNKTKQEAADIAANVTVDFARRGKIAPLMSAFYLFYNPAVQGAANTVNVITNGQGWKGAAKGAAGVIAPLAALGYMVASMSAMAVGDDDEPYWDSPAYREAKLKNLIFFNPDGSRQMVPIPYGMGLFVNLGYAINDIARGRPLSEASLFMLKSIATHFSPLGNPENPISFVSPTAIDPVMVLFSEKREDGNPLMPVDYTGSTPDSARYFMKTRGTLVQEFTSWLNRQTGGNESYPGKIDVSPESVNYLINFATGGAGSFVKDLIQTLDLTITDSFGTALEKGVVPIAKSFYRAADSRPYASTFYENMKKVEAATKEAKEQADSDDPATQDRIWKNSGIASMSRALRYSKEQLAALRKQDIEIIDDPEMSRAQKEAARKMIDEDRKALFAEFNRAFRLNSED